MAGIDRRRSRGGIHALFLALVLTVVVPAAIAPARSATAQTVDANVTLELLSQTASVGPDDDRFGLRVLARNTGDGAIGQLDVRLALGPSFVSRTDYETWLVPGTRTVPTYSTRIPFDGTIEPGAVRQFAVSVDPATIPVLPPTDSGVFPLQVEVRSAGVPVAIVNTSFVWIVRAPDRPVSFSWWTELDAPLPLDPTGRLIDPSFEDAIAEGGRLVAQVDALARLAAREMPIDLVVRPALLEQLIRMRDGYERVIGADVIEVGPDDAGARNAAALLTTLSDAVSSGSVQVSAMPFAGPSIPSLLLGGLQTHLEAQRSLGHDWTFDALGVPAAVAVARPPGGLLSDDALAWLAGKGTRTILADADAVERPPQLNDYAFPSTATVATSRGDVTLVLPDPGTQALLERDDLLADPVRAAQAVYGELAVIWRESPVPPPQPDGTPTQRGLALQLPTSIPPGLWPQLTGRLGSAPFLAPAHAQDHVAAVVPAGPTAELLTPSFEGFSETYAGDARRLRRDVDDMASMFTEPTPLPARLRRNLYTAEAFTFLDDELGGRAWLDSVGRETSLAFERVTPQVQVFTLTSREGNIPLLMGDPGPVPVEVTVQLQSRSFQFPDGSQQELELEPGRRQVVTFSVVSTSAGRHIVRVLVLSPSGRAVSDQQVVIRSTALNAIALVVTGAAALVLFALWLRRWVRRRTA